MTPGLWLTLRLAIQIATVAAAQSVATGPVPKDGNSPPEYPHAALGDAVIGRVEIDVTVDPDGRPRDPKVVKVAPPGYDFETAATRAVMGWRFDPALDSGKPITGTYRAAFDFRPAGPVHIKRWIQADRQPIRLRVGSDAILVEPAPGWARTSRQFSDFALSLEYRALEPKSEVGLLVRAGGSDRDGRSFYRINLTDQTTGDRAMGRVGAKGAPMKEASFDQSALAAVARTAGEWRALSVTADDDTIVVTLNGVRVSVVAQVVNRVGYIGLEGHRGRIEVRNIVVRRLDKYLVPALSGDSQTPLERGGESGLTYPMPVKQPRPSYTHEAMQNKTQGVVWLEVAVRADGTVGQVRVAKSLDLDLDQQAVGTVRRWLFKPASKDGQAVPCIVEVKMTFTLK